MTMSGIKSNPILLGLISALFFAVTFILNRLMAVDGGLWVWTAAFRYYWMLVILWLIVWKRGGLSGLFRVMRQRPAAWLLWSTIGFGIFYCLLCYGASYGPAWLVAGTFEITIIAGMLMGPFIERNKNIRSAISGKALLCACIIVGGVVLMQLQHATTIKASQLWQGFLPVLLSAFAYPLGNRKMMQITDGSLDAYQRTLGMTLASIPFWIILSVATLAQHRLPTTGQLQQTFLVALLSGVIATVLFFTATDLVRKNSTRLAAVEATQSTEVIIALAGEMLLLHSGLPDYVSCIGIALVIAGLFLYSKVGHT